MHLDVRADNLRGADGAIRGVLDWSNALLADPDLELCRLAEYARIRRNALDFDAITTAYAAQPRGDARSWIYRLDAAAMLALVFLSEAPDADEGARAVERLLAVRRRVMAEL